MHLFLRHDEFHDLEMSSFQVDYFEIKDGIVDSIVLKVYGKSDKTWVHLRLWSDHENPVFCPIRHLLIYLHVTGIKKGYLFPSAKELNNPPANGHFQTMINYSKFLRDLQKVTDAVLPERNGIKLNIGSHTFRKTAYLFAVFGRGDPPEIRLAARHMREKNASTYSRDANACYRTHLNSPNALNNVSEWKPMTVLTARNAQRMSQLGGYKQIDIDKLGAYFVNEILQIKKGDPLEYDQMHLLEKAEKYVSTDSPRELFKKFLSTLPNEKQDELKLIFSMALAERVREREDADSKDGKDTPEESEGTVTGGSDAASSNLTDNPPGTHSASKGAMRPSATSPSKRSRPSASETPNKRARIDTNEEKNDLPDRHQLQHVDAKAKVRLMVSMSKAFKKTTELTPGAKTFAVRFLKPTISCINNHFDGDIDAFFGFYPNYRHTKFGSTCCDGTGPTCTLPSAANVQSP